MTVSTTVLLAGRPEAVRAYLRDPARRPQWQGSLRRVVDVHGTGEVGTTWRDVTWPGLRPQLRVTEDTPDRWVETGRWRGWSAELAMDFAPAPHQGGPGTRVEVTAALHPPRLLAWARRPMEALAVRAIAGDVRRAGTIIARTSG